MPAPDKKIQVEIFVKEEWEASYSMRREDMDKVYKYMDLLQMTETDEFDSSSLDAEINDAHEQLGIA